MPVKILDIHIHSRYSRACSPDLELPKIARACEIKGIDIVATGDFTHPAWFAHIKDSLIEENEGIYKLKNENSKTRFILSTEISCIYKHKDATRRVHLLILAPNIAAVDKFNRILEKRGINIRSDGRPIMGLSSKEALKIILDIDPGFMMIPAHIWTPWFSVLGSKSGYNSLEECFEELSPQIRVAETGLSSDPPMNRRLSILDNINLIRELGGNLDEIVLAGGIAKSKLWLQIIADVTGCVISLPEETEGAAFGGALVAGIGTGIYENAETAIQKTVKIRRGVCQPDPKNNELYKEMYEIYKGLYPALKQTYARLGELREKQNA